MGQDCDCGIYGRFFDLVPDMCSISSTDGFFLEVNPAFSKTLGHTASELKRRPFIDLIHPDDVSATLKELAKLSQGAPTIAFENRYRTKAGTYRTLFWTAHPDGDRIFAIARDVTTQKKAEATLQAWAMCDYLTGLPSRRQFDVRLHEAIGRAEPFFLVFADIDKFKRINDGKGHAHGDEVLMHVANTLKSVCRRDDHTFRIGGDEFAIIATQCEDIAPMIERARDLCQYSISMGWARYPDNGKSGSELMARADRAMYKDKRSKDEDEKEAHKVVPIHGKEQPA